jgi:hypothetical protein
MKIKYHVSTYRSQLWYDAYSDAILKFKELRKTHPEVLIFEKHIHKNEIVKCVTLEGRSYLTPIH